MLSASLLRAFLNPHDLLNSLLQSTTPKQIRDVLESIGDFADVSLDEPFGKFDMRWRAFGDNPSNISSIGLGSKAGRSLTERITNAQDALLEDRATSSSALPQSPRRAALQWFGRPATGPDDGLFRWKFDDHSFDRRIAVVLNESGVANAPTVDVVDQGIGIAPADFPTTILSLQKGNKINKWYVMGAFGQGGAATLAFADYALVVSRHAGTNTVGFTVVRVLNLSEKFKEDSYAYLVDASGSVLFFEAPPGPLAIYPADATLKSLPTLSKGTLVRHVAYKLSGLDKTLSASPGNLYHYLHSSMFDPLLPFRIMDARSSTAPKDELVTGSRNRLMRLTLKAEKAKSDGESDIEGESGIRHHRPMEYIVPQGGTEASIGIEYWVVLNYKKKGKANERVLRAHSNELFVQTGHPIIGTLNGQNQGELSAQVLREVKLPLIARHIVVHIDASGANPRVRRELFATNREGFKDGDVLDGLVQMLRKMFTEDLELKKIESELTDAVSKKSVQETSAEVKKQVTKLLQDAGLSVGEVGETEKPGEGELSTVTKKKRGQYKKQEPLPTLPYPQVTRFVIVHPKPRLEVHLQDSETVLVETDADVEFDQKGQLAIRCEPPVLEQAGKAPLKGGRVRWRLRPIDGTSVGAVGKVIVSLTRPDGSQITDSTEYEVLAPLEEKSKKEKGQVPPFEIVAINPDEHPGEWSTAWPELQDEEDETQLGAVAYRAVTSSKATVVYYSTIFAPFKEQLERLKNADGMASMLELFRTNYEIWIAYHAILQENKAQERPGDEQMDLAREGERALVAQMQIKQALRTAELMRKLQQEQASSSS